MKKILLILTFIFISINCFADIQYGNNSVSVDSTGDWTFSTMAFGEMGVSYNALATTVSSSSVYYQVTQNVIVGAGITNMTFANAAITLSVDGTYMIVSSMSFSGANNADIHGGISIDGAQPEGDHSFSRKLGAGGDIGNIGTVEVHALTTGQTISMQVENITNTNDIVVEHMNITVIKVAP